MLQKLVLLSILAFSACVAIEQVSSYMSPPHFGGWVNNTQYLYFNSSSSEHFISNATVTGGNISLHATVIVNNSHADLGWDFVYVSAENAWNDTADVRRMAYYHAGLAEGWVTAERIWQVWLANEPGLKVDQDVTDWIETHIAFMKRNTLNQTKDAFWRKIGDLFSMMEGIADGFNKNTTFRKTINNETLTFDDIFYLNFANEISDVQAHFSTNTTGSNLQAMLSHQHCSALVKHTGDDIYFSHDTWSNYTTMLRQYKTYAMETIVTMSGFAGTIASGDDWYMTNNSLAVQETTNDYYNKTLAVDFVVPDSVSEFLRVMAANFNTADGKNWSETFARYNSGTYCNQYMILDGKLFKPHKDLPDNLFWVAEQMPGKVLSADQSGHLRNHSYWASYNIPFYNEIYVDSGFARLEQSEGTFWSHKKYARAEIFARNETYVNDLDDMRKMMRFNEWQNDTLSKIPNCSYCTPNSPMLSIASRGDLVPDDAILPNKEQYAQFFEKGAFGAIDSKITSALLVRNMTGTVICGPTHETQTPFQFSNSSYPHLQPPGSPDLFDFDWVTFIVPFIPPPPPHGYYTSVAPTWKVIGIVIGVIAGIAVVLAGFFYYVRRTRSPDASYEKV